MRSSVPWHTLVLLLKPGLMFWLSKVGWRPSTSKLANLLDLPQLSDMTSISIHAPKEHVRSRLPKKTEKQSDEDWSAFEIRIIGRTQSSWLTIITSLGTNICGTPSSSDWTLRFRGATWMRRINVMQRSRCKIWTFDARLGRTRSTYHQLEIV